MAEKVVMIALSPTMETGRIVRWNKAEGDNVSTGDLLCEVETDKAAMDYESTVEGKLLKIVAAQGSSVKVGELIAVVGMQGEDISDILGQMPQGETSKATSQKIEGHKAEKKDQVEKTEQLEGYTHLPSGVKASPLARELATQKGIDLRKVHGTGPGGRITKQDIEHTPKSSVITETKPAHKAPTVKAPQDVRVPLTDKRKIIAQRLSQSMVSSPHFYLTVSVQMDSVISARKALNEQSSKKVSLNAFLIKLVAEALKGHSQINSSWDGDAIIYHGSIDIAVAVAQQDGLITPVVRDCANKGIITINAELEDLVSRARDGRLSFDEYSGATFTISNLGSYGVRQFTAIINPPAAAILAVGEIFKEFKENEHGEIFGVDTMLLTLSCDHRVIDGAVAALFAKDLKKIIQNPITVLY